MASFSFFFANNLAPYKKGGNEYENSNQSIKGHVG